MEALATAAAAQNKDDQKALNSKSDRIPAVGGPVFKLAMLGREPTPTSP